MSDDHVVLPDEDATPDPAQAAAPTGEPTVVEQPAEPAGLVCTECGTQIEPNQQYCLACGAPTPFAVPLRARRSAPALIAASLLALGIGGASIIYAATNEDSDQTGSASVPTVNTQPTIATFPTFPTGTNPFPTGTLPTVPTLSTFTTATTFTTNTTFTTTRTVTVTRSSTTTPTTNYDDEDDWLYGDEARWTVVMRSYEDLIDAQNYCATLKSNNFACGIINSSFYSTLNPDYFVVFHGAYLTKAKADQELNRIKSTYPSAYVRKVEY